MANVYEGWKGAVEPLDDGTATANIYEAWKGAVEPVETAVGGGSAVPIILQNQVSLPQLFPAAIVAGVARKFILNERQSRRRFWQFWR